MKCLSCQKDFPSSRITFFHHIALCMGCKTLGEKLEAEIEREFNKARHSATVWLEQHILRGGLMRGGSGFSAEEIETPKLPEADL